MERPTSSQTVTGTSPQPSIRSPQRQNRPHQTQRQLQFGLYAPSVLGEVPLPPTRQTSTGNVDLSQSAQQQRQLVEHPQQQGPGHFQTRRAPQHGENANGVHVLLEPSTPMPHTRHSVVPLRPSKSSQQPTRPVGHPQREETGNNHTRRSQKFGGYTPSFFEQSKPSVKHSHHQETKPYPTPGLPNYCEYEDPSNVNQGVAGMPSDHDRKETRRSLYSLLEEEQNLGEDSSYQNTRRSNPFFSEESESGLGLRRSRTGITLNTFPPAPSLRRTVADPPLSDRGPPSSRKAAIGREESESGLGLRRSRTGITLNTFPPAPSLRRTVADPPLSDRGPPSSRKAAIGREESESGLGLRRSRTGITLNTFPPAPSLRLTVADPPLSDRGPPSSRKAAIGRVSGSGPGLRRSRTDINQDTFPPAPFFRPTVTDPPLSDEWKAAIGGEASKTPAPRPTYPNKLQFHHLPEKLASQHFKFFLERVTGCTPVNIRYGDEENALATFTEHPDLERIQIQCLQEDIDGRHLTVSRVPVTNAILVRNLNPSTEKKTVRRFFENHARSGGGSVQKVEMIPDECKCIVYFKDHEVIKSVLSRKTPTLDNCTLRITQYFECLGPSGGRDNPEEFSVPEAFSLENVSKPELLYIQKCPVWDEFKDLLSQLHASPRLSDDTIKLECTLTSAVPRGRRLVRTWRSDVEEEVKKCLKEVRVQEVPVPQEIWSVVTTNLDGVPDDVAITVSDPDNRCIIVVGKEPSYSTLLKKVNERLKAEKKAMKKKKQEVKKTVKLELNQISLLEAVSFQTSQSGVLIETNSKDKLITFRGKESFVKDAHRRMSALVFKIQWEQWADIPNGKKTLLQRRQTKRCIMEKFKEEQVIAVWEPSASKEHIMFYAFSAEDVKEALSIADASLVEDAITLCKEETDLLKSSEWITFADELLTDRYTGTLHISANPEEQKIRITCIDSILPNTQKDITDFLKSNTIFTEVVCFSKNRQKFVVSVWSSKLKAINDKLVDKNVQITAQETEFHLKGTNFGLGEAKKELQELGNQVLVHKKTYTDMAMVKYFRLLECQKGLKQCGLGNRCVLALDFEPNSTLQAKTYRQMFPQHVSTPEQRNDGVVQATAPTKLTVSIVEGDIALQKGDVLVQSTTPDFNLQSGGVSGSLLNKAGQALQDECKTKYPGGIKVGEIADTEGHGLTCKAVYTLTLPDWHSANSKKNLRDMIRECLTKASIHDYTSLVFPAMGTRLMSYPRDETARIMLDTIYTFHRSYPCTSLRDVRIVICQSDTQTVQAFRNVHEELQRLVSSQQDKNSSENVHCLPPFVIGDTTKTSNAEIVRPVTEVIQAVTLPLQPTSFASSADVFVYAESNKDVQPALRALEECVHKKVPLVVLKDNAIKLMEESELEQLRQAGQVKDVEVSVKQEAGQLDLLGHINNVSMVQMEIKDIINKVEIRRHEEELMTKFVQWCYIALTNTDHTPQKYPKRQNKMIEDAYLQKRTCADIADSGGNVSIDFDSMMAYVEGQNDAFAFVIRRDMSGLDTARVQLPTKWLPHKKGENLKVVPLKSSGNEYQQVAKNFTATLNTEVNIVNIDRVQNRLLMSYYLAKKVFLDQHNPPDTQNERTLWHGTSSLATWSINQDGFNRSYCGKNATVYGQGVYFAVNSSYSAQPTYSEEEAGKGNSYIYQCKVLTGCATKGDSSMRYLPKRDGQTSFDSATDDVRKPSMYVIFSDTQAYPEYIITFKRKID